MRYLKTRFLAVYAAVAALCLSAVSMASAEGITPEYSKLTSGVTSELGLVVPIVIVALGSIIGISFAIKWASKRFGGAK
jgi:hypothetical protein